MSAWWAVQESAGLVLLYACPFFWHILVSLLMLLSTVLLAMIHPSIGFVVLLALVPYLLLSVAHLFDDVVGVASPGHEEPHAYMARGAGGDLDDGGDDGADGEPVRGLGRNYDDDL
jgi:hypothetical protein